MTYSKTHSYDMSAQFERSRMAGITKADNEFLENFLNDLPDFYDAQSAIAKAGGDEKKKYKGDFPRKISIDALKQLEFYKELKDFCQRNNLAMYVFLANREIDKEKRQAQQVAGLKPKKELKTVMTVEVHFNKGFRQSHVTDGYYSPDAPPGPREKPNALQVFFNPSLWKSNQKKRNETPHVVKITHADFDY